ncbi:hypothetical protein ABPG77_006663 [Micractinium sp. CCAP 211/92]
MSSPTPSGPPPDTPRRDDGRGKLAEVFTDDEEQSLAFCRVCWAPDDSAALLSPCLCSGTQKHVHLKCLRRWQESVQKRNSFDERAFRCSVCRTLFSVPPPKARPGGGPAVQVLRGLVSALIIALVAYALGNATSGPLWPHVTLLVLLVAGSRWHWLPLGLLLGFSIIAGMNARNLRLVVRLDGGGRLGVALIRHGAPVPGIGPGVLLVASEGLDRSPIFRRSVILLTQHGRGGARGVMLSQPIAHPPALPASLGAISAGTGAPASTAAAGSGQPAAGAGKTSGAAPGGSVPLRHFLGGPVGMPGEGVNHEVAVLHFVPGIADSRLILPQPTSPGNRTAPAAPGAAAADTGRPSGDAAESSSQAGGAADGGAAGTPHLYEGGSLGEIMEQAAAAAARGRRGHSASRRGGKAGDAAALPVLLFHGVCAWAEGQLEGELRAGAWAFTARPAGDLLGLLGQPHEELWQALTSSPALMRVR